MKVNKRYLIIGVPLILVIAGIIAYLTYFLSELDEAKRGYYQSFDPTTEIGKANIEQRKQIRKEMEHEITGDKYLKQGKYEQAIEEFKKIPNEWLSHSWLADAYEKAGRHEEAIKEIDWLVAQQPRQDVIQELQERKGKLQDLLEEQNFQ